MLFNHIMVVIPISETKRAITKAGKILVNYRSRFKSTSVKRRRAALADCIITANKVKGILKTNDEALKRAQHKYKFCQIKKAR